ncbi:TonB-dependent siderophore receptor [Erythrobacter sp. AP23]|uniref:TonB-dependent receptor plug domain-containing protein n=1 Tax=Erythrobacter sp. AP23 TaxID=499656 RepID=UPI000A47B2C7|nr:TonB-dependent receptor [Erythrobacter sp. AP23]
MRITKTTVSLKAIMFACVAPLAIGGFAPAVSAQSAPPAETEDGEGDDDNVITVTGSRLDATGFTAPTPVTTFDAEDLTQAGTPTVAEFLSTIPAFVNNESPQNTGINSSGNANASVNLRNLGAGRTLVLVNGRRHVPTGTSGTVNTSLIPSSMIGQIEVVTGGASAAWGSDAVSGVVNILYRTDVDGLELDGQVGISQRGDNEEYRLSATYGAPIGDRGRFMIAAEYYKTEGITAQRDRDWGRDELQIIPNTANTGENDGIPRNLLASNVRTANSSLNGVILNPNTLAPFQTGPLANLQFAPGVGTQPFNRGTNTSFLWTIGGDGTNFSQDTDLIIPNSRKALFAVFEHEITDDIEFYFEGSYTQAEAESGVVQNFNFAPGGVVGVVPIRIDNAFLPASVRAAMVTQGITQFSLGRVNNDMGFINSTTRNVTTRFVGGLRGDLDQNWNWDFYYQYGENSFQNELENNRITANFFEAADAIVDPGSGNIVCRSGNPACVPLNLFGFGSPSAEAIDYVHATTRQLSDRSQEVAALTIRGDLLQLPAGAVKTAFGGEYRSESTDFRNDELGKRNEVFLLTGGDLAGSYKVKEAFAEVLVPILADKPFFDLLELNGAVRYTDYTTIGDLVTWKVGGSWRPFEDLRLRATYSSDIRAPNLAELFTAQALVFNNVGVDPCSALGRAGSPAIDANCTAEGVPPTVPNGGTITTPIGGNPDLQEESAKTLTAGFVYSPSWAPRVNLSFDYFDIKLADAIGTLPLARILEGCYEDGNQALCDAITRGPDSSIQSVNLTALNIASRRISGVDGELSVRVPGDAVFGGAAGDFNFRVIGSYLFRDETSTDGIVVIEGAGGADQPKLRMNLDLGYTADNWGITSRVNFIGSSKFDVNFDVEDLDLNDVNSETYVNLSAFYDVAMGDRELRLYGGINNLFDNDPARTVDRDFQNAYATVPGLHDVIGRRFFVGARVSF